ncbi:MAG: Asp-tRNA(Asn)/Glu-tRNA(Gln) amidotransferase subunit GatB [Candidatus Brocadiia bacterium]
MSLHNPVVGLEIHAQLMTMSKLFCSCACEFAAVPNSLTCPTCAGLPGSLPVLNREAVILAIMAGLALECNIASTSRFDRKNYFYPDLPKGYQITQYEHPLCFGGRLVVASAGEARPIRIRRMHIEEDAGKQNHSSTPRETTIDMNRAGTPLIEIVTEPDIRSAEEVLEFLASLKRILRFLRISDCEMQEGSLRVDVNISVMPKDSRELGIPVEVKNLGSFKQAAAATRYEIHRQSALAAQGTPVRRETRLWDDEDQVTRPMRAKEGEDDYRYFPEPDLPPLLVGSELIAEARSRMVELPGERAKRYSDVLGLSLSAAADLTSEREIAELFERTTALCGDAQEACQWIRGEVMSAINDRGGIRKGLPVTAEALDELIGLVKEGRISLATARREIWPRMLAGEGHASEIASAQGLFALIREELDSLYKKIISENPGVVSDILKGKHKAVSVLVGCIMAQTRGAANADKAAAEFLSRILRKDG